MNTYPVFAPERNPITDLRQADSEAAQFVKDICDYAESGDYRRASYAAAYLLLYLAAKASLRPLSILKKINH